MTGISLEKGGNLSLTKQEPGLRRALVGLGWDPRPTDGQEFDLDASAFLVGENGKVRSGADFVFYNQLLAAEASGVVHTGDNRTGEGDGDDEKLIVDLTKVPSDIHRIIFAVTIHEAEARGQNFGQVRNAFIRIANDESNKEIVRYDLEEEASLLKAQIFGELYRHNAEWKFRAVGQGFEGGLKALANHHGVTL